METIALLVLLSALFGAPGAQAQSQGPITPPPAKEVIRIPATAKPDAPPIPVEQIIQRFTEKEDEFSRAGGSYTFRKTIRVQEFGEDGKPAGEIQVITQPFLGTDGRRYERIIEEKTSTLRRMNLDPEDLETLARMPQYFLTSDQVVKYELTYAGQQPVDEISTYLFRVKPRQLERTRAYFEGLVWVDDRDLQIVKTYGKWITEVGDVTSPELPFVMFETYRQPVEKYWFPAYSRSDDVLHSKNGDTRVRLTIRWEGYKPIPAAK